MSTKTVDETLALWLDLEADGELEAEERERLQARLDSQPSLAAEQRRCRALHDALASSRVEVGEDFTRRVMDALPVAAWQRPASTAWRLPLAMMLFLALGAALVLGSVAGDHPVIGTGLAVLDFAQTTVLAGSGIVVATWRGAGMGLEELMAGSSLNLVAFAALVVCLNLLFVSLLRRRRQGAEAAAGSEES